MLLRLRREGQRSGPHGANKIGLKTVAFQDDVRGAHDLVVALGEEDLFVGDPDSLIERLQTLLARGADYMDFWAFLVHGNSLPRTSDFLEGRREWYEWTKHATLAVRLALAEVVRARHALIATAARE